MPRRCRLSSVAGHNQVYVNFPQGQTALNALIFLYYYLLVFLQFLLPIFSTADLLSWKPIQQAQEHSAHSGKYSELSQWMEMYAQKEIRDFNLLYRSIKALYARARWSRNHFQTTCSLSSIWRASLRKEVKTSFMCCCTSFSGAFQAHSKARCARR